MIAAGNLAGFTYAFDSGRESEPRFVVLALHGTGGDERSMLGPVRSWTSAPILSPRGRVLEGGHAARFFRRFAEGVFDEADIRARAVELKAFLAEATAQHGLGDLPVYAIGYSNGANMAAATMLLEPGVLSGGVLLRPMMMLAHPPKAVSKPAGDVLLLSGDRDPICPPESGAALHQALERAGMTTRRVLLPAGHGLTMTDGDLSREWFTTRQG